MKILVTGGNGFVGREICNHLVSMGIETRSLDLQKVEGIKGVESIQGNILDANAVKKAVHGVQRVIHSAALVPVRSGKKSGPVNTDGTRVVLEAAISAGVEHFTYLSSSAVYGKDGRDGGASLPTLTPHPIEEYGHSKLEGERICRNRQSEIGIGILRPRTIMGPGRLGIFSLLFERVSTGKDIFTLGSGHQPLQLIALSDVTHLIANCSIHHCNGTFNLGGHDTRTMRETLEALCVCANSGSNVRTLPVLPAKFLLLILDRLQLSPFSNWHYKTLDHAMLLDTSLTDDKLGNCRTSSVEALLSSYSWYIANLNKKKNTIDTLTHREAVKPGIFRFF